MNRQFYLKIYNNLIYKRKYINVLTKSHNYLGEYENHHIIPHACNGSNDKSNIVCLTVREHYIAHLLLYYIYKNTIYENSMLLAITYMTCGSIYSKRHTYKFNSKLQSKLTILARKNIKHKSYKGYINITNGNINKMIPPEQLDYYINQGWKRGQTQKISITTKQRRGDKYRNTYFITNGIINLRINKNDPIPLGYYKGRVFKCDHLSKHPTMKNNKWMHKNGIEIHVPIDKIQIYTQQGYQLGRCNNKKFILSTQGKICINNGNINKYINPNELILWEQRGWKRGQIK